MNVLVMNEQQSQLQLSEIDIIKSVTGQFEASEIVSMFKDFFFNKLILDVTALKGYDMPLTYKTVVDGLNPDKVIFYFKEGSDLCTSGFLSRLINYGIYNFTTNLEGVKYLVKNTNTLKDVENILSLVENNNSQLNVEKNNSNSEVVNNVVYEPINNKKRMIIGFENITTNAGATSLIYMLKKELSITYKDRVVAIEIDKYDFLSFKDESMISTTSEDIKDTLAKYNDKDIILIDLNSCKVNDICKTIYYLIEPSTIKINTLMRKNKNIISSLKNKKVVLNKSLLTEKEVSEFEYESGLKILYNMPPLNDRKRNAVIADFLKKINLVSDKNATESSGKIFGLFRK